VTVRVDIDKDDRVVHSTFGGVLTVVDVLQGRAEAAKHPDFDRTFTHVLDFTQVTAVDLEPQTLRDIIALPSIFEPDAVQVIVAPPMSPMFRIAHAFKAAAEGTNRDIRVAETLDEARTLIIAFR
jgi:hypothetical protein